MAEIPRETLDYPIPGQGMTAEVGSRPWQNPPQYTTVEPVSYTHLRAHET